MRCEKLRHHLLLSLKIKAYAAYRARDAARLRRCQHGVVEKVLEQSEQSTVMAAEATACFVHCGTLRLDPLSL